LFVIQGVTTCINGTGYCMLGKNCSVDVDFLPDVTGGHCLGLRDAFTPKIDFVCCKYNPFGKVTSDPPTTTINSYTITDVFSLIDEEVGNQQMEDEFPEDINPENVIDIVGVVTDFTGIVGLVTRPWTGTFPTKASSPTTTPMTPTTPTTTSPPASPGTPADINQITVDFLTEEAPNVATAETTENYNEIPTDVGEHPISSHQDDQTTEPDQIESTTNPLIPTVEEVAYVAVVINNDNDIASTHSPVVTPLDISADEFDESIIIFPDNPIVSKLPPLEVEALEAVTDSIVHVNTVKETISVTDSGKVQDNHAEVSINTPAESTFAEPKPDTAHISLSQESSAVIDNDQLEVNHLQEPNNIDYDYYSEYPDQLLLQPVNHNICGFKSFKNYINKESSSRILGGVVASTVEWCWVAAIMERRQGGDKYVCTGSLVESNLVLTTATCLKRLESRDLSNYIVVLGDSNLREDLPYGIQFHAVMEIVLHPNYFTSGGAHANDIGVVRLRDHATLSDNVCLLCMAQQDAIFPAQSCSVAGYGIGDVPYSMLRDVSAIVPSDGILRQMSVPVLKKNTCQGALQNLTGSEILSTSDTFICAGGLADGNACYSTMDGGSPLACEAGGRWFLAGIVSWSRDCENQDVPNIYTRVSAFSNWLQSTYLRMLGFLTHQIRLV
ncbi:hypothetical protein SK128_026414, partial [Halocaridina rubra]